MGLNWPKYPQDVNDGDEVSHAPTKNDRSLLGTERGTDSTRRLELDTDRNLYTNIGADSRSESLLYSASLSTIADSTPTAFTAYTAPSAQKIYRVEVTGSGCADYALRINASTVGMKQTNIEMGVVFTFDRGYPVAFGDSVDLVVEHFVPGKTKDFNLYVYGA